jgi:hypothetical protein
MSTNPGPASTVTTNTQPLTSGEFSSEIASTFSLTKRARNIAFLGDSNTDNGFFPSNGSVRLTNVSSAKFFTDVLPFAWAQAQEGLDFDNLYNFAVKGKTCQDALGWLDQVIAARPDVSASMNVGVFATYMGQIYTQLIQAGIYVIALLCPPYGAPGNVNNTQAKVNLVSQYNQFIVNFWKGNTLTGASVDIFTGMADTTVARAPCKTNYFWDLAQDPSIHYANLAAIAAGAALAPALTPIMALKQLPINNNDTKVLNPWSTNILDNPCFIGTSGTKGTGTTGTVATNWNTLGSTTHVTGVAQIVAPLTGVGNSQEVVWTSDATGGNGFIYTDGVQSRAVLGDNLQGGVLIRISGATNLIQLKVNWADNVGGSWEWGSTNNNGTGGGSERQPLPSDFVLKCVLTPKASWSYSGSPTLRLWVQAVFGGVGGATVQIERAALWNTGNA